jgi:anti-sigma-K factor RskA
MPNDRNTPIPTEQLQAEEALATRYVLGELNEEEFANFEARYASDKGFRDRYNAWSEGLSQPDKVQEKQAASGFAALKSRLFPSDDPGLLGRLGVLPAVIGALLAALLVAFVSNLGVLDPQDGISTNQTVLATDNGELIAETVLDEETATLTVRILDGTPDAGRVFEVWLVEGDGIPLSLGTLSKTDRSTQLQLSAAQIATLRGGALVMTQEPNGGAGAAGPTGNVVAAGAFASP